VELGLLALQGIFGDFMVRAEQQSIKQEGYALAMRYMANAKEALDKAGRDGRRFKDSKYVSSASGIAYKGALAALDTWLALKGVEIPKSIVKKKGEKGKKEHKSVKNIGFYRDNLTNLDKKLLDNLNEAYDALHLRGYYDGELSANTIDYGFEMAYEMIDKIKPEVL
jgi:hypothetical protein